MSQLLHQAVTASARSRPDATAVVFGGECLTYSDLEVRSNRLAQALVEAGCETGDRVCFAIPKSLDAIVAIIGILKAGCIYTPLDVSSPPARLASIIASCEPAVALTTRRNLDLVMQALGESAVRRRVVGLVDSDDLPGQAAARSFSALDIASRPVSSPQRQVSPDQPAYILFTSGSTGTPKGVPISHNNVLAFVKWANRRFGVRPDDRLSGHTALHFDLSVYDLFGTLCAGAELRLVPPDVSMLPNKTAEFIRSNRLTQWFSVPSALNYMCKFDVIAQDDFPQLKRILWCGEALPTPALIHMMERLPHVQFTNLYGPTETTIASSYYTVPQVPATPSSPIPIGVACDGESIAVLDENLRPVKPGVTGDLYIGGDGLSSGYWRDEDKTLAAFTESPPETGMGRVYKTGDLAYMDDDGLCYFVGRSDTQVKSRGYRIELGEIEAALSSVPELVESAVVAIASDGFEGSVICCAYALSPRFELPAAEVRDRLRKLIPDYMLPARWNRYEALPKNANGKIDRVALKRDFAEETAALAKSSL